MDVFKQKEKGSRLVFRVPFRFQYRVKEAAELLGMSERSLATLITERQIGSYKIKGSRFIATKELRQFVEKVSTAGEAA